MRFLAAIGAFAIVLALGAGVYFLGGFYSVAATYEDPVIVQRLLAGVREMSVGSHARSIPDRPGLDMTLVRRGAVAFLDRGCATCHGAPGVAWAKFAEGMNPAPPDLGEVAKELQVREIFWAVKNGIRMTGMPGFAGTGMEDEEAWAIAAFVKKLPEVNETDFKAWTAR